MKRALILFALLAPAPAAAQDAPPPLMLRLSVAPEGQVLFGQRVTVTLTVMTPVRFTAPPIFPDLAPRGRAIVLPEGTTVPGTERIGGQSLAALQHSYDLFPAEAGALVLPALRMAARVADANGQAVDATADAPGLSIAVRLPPGVAGLARLVVAPEFRLTMGTDRTPQGLRVGEAITRTLRMEARDTAAMLLPPASWGHPEGLAVYPDPPELQDQTARGELRAVRQERAAYVPLRPGPVELPGFSVTWFQPASGRAQVVDVDAIRFEALPAVAASGPGAARGWGAGLAVALPIVVLALGLWLLRARRHRERADRIERQAYAALRKACRAGDPRAALSALFRWSDAVVAPTAGRGIAACAEAGRSPALIEEARRLESRLYGTAAAGPWQGAGLLRAARIARRQLRRRPGRHSPTAALPPLNAIGGIGSPPENNRAPTPFIAGGFP